MPQLPSTLQSACPLIESGMRQTCAFSSSSWSGGLLQATLGLQTRECRHWRHSIDRQARECRHSRQMPYGHLALLDRIWRLRANLTAYDASYVALAELLGLDLLTVDRRLASVPGIRCHVEV